MRPIKFRAWNKEDKEMVKVLSLHIDEEMIEFDNMGHEDTWNTEHFELMQFTGLLDKNGKEIYEGDIVRVKYSGKQYGTKVYFDDGCFFANHCIDVLNDLWMPNGLCGLVKNGEVEVIGNIYENPELLK